MERLTECLNKFSSWLWGDWLLFVLLGIGVLYTVITGGIQIRRFPYIIRKTLWEPIREEKRDSEESGTITSFQSLCTAGGLKRLAHVTQKLVPFMAAIYVVGGLLIIAANITKVPQVLADIFYGAFGMRAMAGGAAGSMFIAMQRGVARGLYSNEAGEGSAPVIHASASVNHPVEQGITGVTEVFLDTFVLCSITGLVIGVTGVLDSGVPGNVLAIHAFASVWEPLRYVVAFSLLLFCITTLMSQWYFGFVGLNYLFNRSVAEKFKYLFPLFCIVGALAEIDLVWTIQDIALGLLTIPNLIALIVLWPQVRRATKEYFETT